MPKKSMLLLYCILNYIIIGVYWISSSWAMLAINNNPGSVGCLLIISSLCTLCLAPFLGVMVDHLGFRYTTLVGLACGTIAGLLPWLISHFGYPIIALDLYGIAWIIGISNVLCLSAFDKLIKLTSPDHALKSLRVSIGTYQQLALMLGTALSGFLISKTTALSVFPIISLLSVLNTGIFLYLISNIDHSPQLSYPSPRYALFYWQGLQHIFQNKNLILAISCIAIAYACAQAINVSLPAFIKLEIHGNSSLFGFCEMSWALGGIFSTMLLSLLLKRYNLDYLPILTLAGLGLGMLWLALIHYPTSIIITCLGLGILFNTTRTLADANLLSLCHHDMIGRVRSNMMALGSLIGIGIYLLPILLNQLMPSMLYSIIGSITIFAGMLLFFLVPKSVIA